MISMRPDKVSRERAKMTIAYPMWLAWSKEDHAYHVRCRDLPEVLTAGSTKAEALEMAADALEVALAGRIEDEEDISGAVEAAKARAPHLSSGATGSKARCLGQRRPDPMR
jgi:predicted RNase H-like HicB family nuclease